ncbi:MAG: site-specific integrase [Nitrososphaeria archaeon]
MGRVQDFLKMYRSKSTTKGYKVAIKHFFKTLYGEGDLEVQAEKYFSEKRNYEDDVERFFQTINDRPPKTIKHYLSAVKMFLLENGVDLSERFWRRLRRRIKGTRALTLDKVPSNEELRKILSHMDLKGKALYLFLASSGMRIGEALQIRLSDLEDGEPYRIKIRGEYTKTGNSRIAFISKEAVHFLNEWLKVREDYLRSAVEKSHLYKKNGEDDRVFPFTEGVAYFMWYNALKDSGYYKKDNSTKRLEIHPHVLRKFFRTRLGAVIPVDVVEALMGHEGYLTEVYRKYSLEELGKFYLQGEGALTIFGSETEEISRLKVEIDEKNKQLQNIITGLVQENMKLKQKIEEVENKFLKLEEELKALREWALKNI